MPPHKTRPSSTTKLTEYVWVSKEFNLSEDPTLRSVIQRGLLIKDRLYAENNEVISTGRGLQTRILNDLVTLILAQWKRANHKFSPPVTISAKSLYNRL